MARPTLLDLTIRNQGDPEVGLIEESVIDVPEVTGRCRWTGNTIPGLGEAKIIRGTSYKTTVRTSLPAGGFRDANEGVVAVKSTYENRLVPTFFFNPRWEADKQLADASEDGAAAYIAEEAVGLLMGAWKQLSQQFYYGTNTTYGGLAKGFPGLIDMVPSANVIDALGDEAATSSSVWLIKWGPKSTRWVLGNNGEFGVSDVRIGDVFDASSNPYTAYIQEIAGQIGLQCANPISDMARIKNLTAPTDETGQLTDALITRAMMTMKTPPDVILMAQRSWGALQMSRTATNATGTEAPMPRDVHGVPIAISTGISITEAVGF
jgi:hypothetical protein